jgi:hypothetical protein
MTFGVPWLWLGNSEPVVEFGNTGMHLMKSAPNHGLLYLSILLSIGIVFVFHHYFYVDLQTDSWLWARDDYSGDSRDLVLLIHSRQMAVESVVLSGVFSCGAAIIFTRVYPDQWRFQLQRDRYKRLMLCAVFLLVSLLGSMVLIANLADEARVAEGSFDVLVQTLLLNFLAALTVFYLALYVLRLFLGSRGYHGG